MTNLVELLNNNDEACRAGERQLTGKSKNWLHLSVT